MKVTFRKLIPEDKFAVIRLLFPHLSEKSDSDVLESKVGSSWMKKYSKMMSMENIDSIGAFLEGELLGVSTLYTLPRLELVKYYGVIEDVFVKVDYRRRGIGTNLVKKCVEAANNRGLEQIVLNADGQNEGVVTFYNKAGFEQDSLGMKIKLV